jgi:hypothetical protein
MRFLSPHYAHLGSIVAENCHSRRQYSTLKCPSECAIIALAARQFLYHLFH